MNHKTTSKRFVHPPTPGKDLPTDPQAQDFPQVEAALAPSVLASKSPPSWSSAPPQSVLPSVLVNAIEQKEDTVINVDNHNTVNNLMSIFAECLRADYMIIRSYLKESTHLQQTSPHLLRTI